MVFKGVLESAHGSGHGVSSEEAHTMFVKERETEKKIIATLYISKLQPRNGHFALRMHQNLRKRQKMTD